MTMDEGELNGWNVISLPPMMESICGNGVEYPFHRNAEYGLFFLSYQTREMKWGYQFHPIQAYQICRESIVCILGVEQRWHYNTSIMDFSGRWWNQNLKITALVKMSFNSYVGIGIACLAMPSHATSCIGRLSQWKQKNFIRFFFHVSYAFIDLFCGRIFI